MLCGRFLLRVPQRDRRPSNGAKDIEHFEGFLRKCIDRRIRNDVVVALLQGALMSRKKKRARKGRKASAHGRRRALGYPGNKQESFSHREKVP
jgi:hypothetical protein